MGWGPDHDHTLLAISELVPRDHALSNRATDKVQAIEVAPMECNNQVNNSQVYEKHPIGCLEADIAICAQSSIRKEIARKVTDSWTKGNKQNYQWMFEQWCSICHKRMLQVLKICVCNWVEYLDYLQVTHDHAYMTLCMHASSICSILEPKKQIRVSMAPLIKQLLKGVFRKKPPARVWTDTWDVKNVLVPPHAWGKPSALNYTHLTLKTVMILALVMVKRPLDLNLLRIIPNAMQMTEDSVTLQLVFGAKNARPNHPYMPTITMRQAEDEFLCPVRHIKEYTAKAKTGWTEVQSSLWP